MTNFNENRRQHSSRDEVYCRYLSIDLPLTPRSPTYKGKFGNELRKIGIEEFPFGISLSDLVLSEALIPSLYVELPREYFDARANFPELPRESVQNEHEIVGMYLCERRPQLAQDLPDLLHPYDNELKATFKVKFESGIPQSFITCEHPNGGHYIPAEVFLPYWQVYALAENFHKIRYAKDFWSAQDGKERCLALIKSTSAAFIQKYGPAFNRISWYKTIVATATFSELDCTQGELIQLAQQYSECTVYLLKVDLQLLLGLDAKWHAILKEYGCPKLGKARSKLSKDIYLIYEQLRLLGLPASDIFDEFTPNSLSHTPLDEVLQFEEYSFKRSFVSYGQHYCSQPQQWGYHCTAEVFDSLIQVPGFDAWMRAFHDLHVSLNDADKQPISFMQNRIVDALIVMAVRTEITLREMFRQKLSAQSDESIVKFLNATKSELCITKQKIIDEACSKNNKGARELYQRPTSLFAAVTNINPPSLSQSQEDMFFLHALLKFMTARNYFAHHAYKDDELNTLISNLPKEILESLFATLLFFHTHKNP